MIIERSKIVSAKIISLEKLRSHTDSAGAFSTRADQLSGPTERLTMLTGILKIFRNRGIQVDFDIIKYAGLKSVVDDLAKKYHNNPDNIIKSDGQLRFSFWEPIRQVPDKLEQSLKGAWDRYINDTIPIGQLNILDVMTHVPGFSDQVKVILRGVQERDRLQQHLPETEDTIDQVQLLAQQLKEAWSALHSDDISKEVLSFLQAASNHSATLMLVTPDVKQWLEKYKLLNAFKVTL